MLRIKTMPYLMKIAAKLDIKPVIEQLKDINIFEDGRAALDQLDKEKAGILGMEILAAVAPQFGKIADDIIPLVAVYKNVTVEEAEDLDLLETVSEIMADEGITRFFNSALRRKAGRKP